MRVTSRLGSFFVEENIRSREATAQETSKFLADEVQETRKRLEAQEEKLKQYKLQFGGELPQQEQANLNRLQRLQDQIKNNSDAIARLADRKVFLEAQISNIERNVRGSDNQDPWETVGSGIRRHPISPFRTRHAKKESWKSCPRNTPRCTRPWCRRAGRWNNWRERLQQCARRPGGPGRNPPVAQPILRPRNPRLTLNRRTGIPGKCDAFADRSPRSTWKLSP